MKKQNNYILEEDYVLYFSSLPKSLVDTFKINHTFYSDIFRLYNHKLIIFKGFKWEGASPVIKVFNSFIQPWEGFVLNGKKQLYYPTLVHDLLYLNIDKITLTRKQMDKIFYELMKENKFILRIPYYLIVRLLGGLYHNRKVN